MTIESFQPLWYLAFFVDVILGCMAFYLVQSGMSTERYLGVGWWVGWWSFADAISLILNGYMGTDYFFSYHQMGIVTDTAINCSLIYFLARYMLDNWGLTAEDWVQIRKIREDAKIRKLQK